MNKYLVVACEYGNPIGAVPCDTMPDASILRTDVYGSHHYHTQGSVDLMCWDEEESEYVPCDWPEPDDGP